MPEKFAGSEPPPIEASNSRSVNRQAGLPVVVGAMGRVDFAVFSIRMNGAETVKRLHDLIGFIDGGGFAEFWLSLPRFSEKENHGKNGNIREYRLLLGDLSGIGNGGGNGF